MKERLKRPNTMKTETTVKRQNTKKVLLQDQKKKSN